MANNKKIQHTGIMNKMRDKMPLIIIILIIAFLATIVFEWGMNYVGLGGGNQAFAMINSREISYQEFEKIVEQQIDQMRQQNEGKDVDEATVTQIREQVWNSLVSQTITQQAIDHYGIKVTDREILDWIYNRPETLPEPVKKQFIDSTGVFNAAGYQQVLNMKSKEATQFWNQVENFLRETLLSEKLQAVITEGAVVSEGDVLDKYKEDNIIAAFDYALLDLSTVTDSLQFPVNETELKNYYDQHKSEFKQEEIVRLKYVQFPETATMEDSSFLLKDLGLLKKDMQSAVEEDSTLIKLINENGGTWKVEFQKANAFGAVVSNFLFNAKPGDVSDVLITPEGYQVAKLLESKDGEELFINASHLLVNFGTDTAAAKQKAQDLYNRVKAGEDISNLAFELSEDPSAKQNRGDLGWFGKGAMVKEFEEACKSTAIGGIVGPIKTQFGFHVIKVTGKEQKEFKVAQISKPVVPGNRTKQLLKKKAEEFYADLEQGQNFDSLSKQNNLSVQLSPDILIAGPVPLAGANKKVLNFVFENKINTYTEPVKVQQGFAIYQIIEKRPEGFLSFDSIKVTMIKPKIVNEKKYQILLGTANDLEGKIKNGDINSLKDVSPQYTYGSADSVSGSKPDAQVGQDFALMESIMKMKPGEISKPIKGTKGYYIIKLKSITEFNEQDYVLKAPEIRKTLLQTKKQTIVSDWLTKMQNEAVIVDNRDKYF